MNKKLKSYLLIIGHLTVGLTILIASQQLTLPSWLNISVVIFLAFLLLNLTHLYIFKLDKELIEFWSLRKIIFLLFGVLGGTLIALSPTAIGVVAGQLNSSDITFNSDISITSIGLTLIIIGWEELWFRGLFLNYCHRHLSSITLSLTIGLLFMLIHILNPKIDLLKTGPSLFFAGALLTILYFYFRTIWLPVGLHFGNNFTGTILKSTKETDILFGNEGYIGTIILAGLFFVFYNRTKKRTTNAQQQIAASGGTVVN